MSYPTADMLTLFTPWMRQGRHHLRRFEDEINAMNVFPVPDADTGSNLLATVSAAAEASTPQEGIQAAFHRARGNSGTLFSAWLSALVRSLGVEGRFTPEALHVALFTAAQAAEKTMTAPAEGTILSVMQALAKAPLTGELPEHLHSLAQVAVEAARATGQTQHEAAQAHTYDAGAVGLFIVINGLSIVYSGRQVPETEYTQLLKSPNQPNTAHRQSQDEVELICELAADVTKIAQLRSDLTPLGDSLTIVPAPEGGAEAQRWLIHLHTAQPDRAVERIRQVAEPDNLRFTSLADGRQEPTPHPTAGRPQDG